MEAAVARCGRCLDRGPVLAQQLYRRGGDGLTEAVMHSAFEQGLRKGESGARH